MFCICAKPSQKSLPKKIRETLISPLRLKPINLYFAKHFVIRQIKKGKAHVQHNTPLKIGFL